MKFTFLSLFFAFTLALSSCSSSKKTSVAPTGSAVAGSMASNTGDADGSSFEKAILINETTETKGIAAEYAWLKKNYPGHKVKSQSLSQHGKKPYDIIHIQTEEGNLVNVYFDISKFFGKF